MSHVVKVVAQMSDLDALEAAAGRLGGELRRNQTKFQYYSHQTQACVHAIVIKGARQGSYEIGLRHASTAQDGKFDLHCDFWSGELTSKFGEGLSILKTEYQAAVGEKFARKRGYAVRRVVDEGRHVRLVATR